MKDNTHFASLSILFSCDEERDKHCVDQAHQALSGVAGITKIHLEKKEAEKGFCIHYDPQKITLAQVKKLAMVSGAKIAKKFKQTSFSLTGIDSNSVATNIEQALNALDGMISANVSYAAEVVRVEYDSSRLSLKKIHRTLSKMGCQLRTEETDRSWIIRYREIILSLTAGLSLLLAWLLETLSIAAPITVALIAIAFISGGIYAARDAIQTLMQRRFDIEVLMVVAALGAGLLGAWNEGALLLFLFSLGHALEHFAMDKARRSIKALAELAPKTAWVKRDDSSQEVRISDLQRDDIVIVRPGQRLPTDGDIVEGHSVIDQAPITGESIPVEKQVGDNVFSGTVNGEGILHIKVTKLAQESTLSRMVKLVEEADTQKSPTQRFTQRFQQIYVPLVLVAVVLLIILPPLFGADWQTTLYRALTVLVAASPCALAIGTPAAILSGVGRAAHFGVLIKGGMHLENLGLTRAMAFDKTGTITKGEPEVQQVLTFTEVNQEEVLRLTAIIEQYSQHPLAQAIVTAAKKNTQLLPEAKNIQSVTGKGIYGQWNNQTIKVGNPKFFDALPSTVTKAVEQLRQHGQTVILVQQQQQFLAAIGVADTVRTEAKETLAKLKAIGIDKTIMLTGDHRMTAQAIADQVGLNEVRAELLPEDKLSVMTDLDQEYQCVAMVGDGVNDAPAMARATVGIAMGGAGTDIALEACDVALMKDDLSQLPTAMALSRVSRRIILQNLWISLGVVAVLVLSALIGITGIGLAVTIHEGSSLVVVANGLRLLRFKPKN